MPEKVFKELMSVLQQLKPKKFGKYNQHLSWLEDKVVKVDKIIYCNNFKYIDDGEIEAISLVKEIKADFLLIDDKRARKIAENNLNIKCLGTLGLLIKAKEKGFIKELRPVFLKLLNHNRYFSKNLLNKILENNSEKPLDI